MCFWGRIWVTALLWLSHDAALIAGENKIKVSHGIARFDDLKYLPDFKHFDYVNPDAPKGGSVSFFSFGTFDSLNPYAPGGITPSQSPVYASMQYGFTGISVLRLKLSKPEDMMFISRFWRKTGCRLMTFLRYGLICTTD